MRSIRQGFSFVLACIFMVTVIGCSNDRSRATPPPAVDDTRYGNPGADQPPFEARQTPTEHRSTLSKHKGLVVLAGAAALYYLYKKHQNAQATEGVDGQYYLSKNGRVYYRDADHRAHWVTPPAQGIQVPADEASQYSGFQGYDNQPTGRDLTDVARSQGAY